MTPTFRLLVCCVALVIISAVCLCSAEVPSPNSKTKNWAAALIEDGKQRERELVFPITSPGDPAAGKRVAVTMEAYAGTAVHHMLYLPPDWHSEWKSRQQRWPVIVEYTGNYFQAAGSTGEVEGAALGYGLTGGQFIWVTLPFIENDGKKNAIRWWGDEAATIQYAKLVIPAICESYGGSEKAVILCGFSRGAIATNYIGLHDDAISSLWCATITHDHYDGVRAWSNTSWGNPLASYREAAAIRLRRLNKRPALICHGQESGTKETQAFISSITSLDPFTFLTIPTQDILGPFPNAYAVHPHNDRWLIKDSAQRRQIWRWVYDVVHPIIEKW